MQIELNGVEHRILTVPGVADAAVIARSVAGEAVGLLACVQPIVGQAADTALADRILAECRAWLPRAAVPASVVFVDTMPKGPSGKKAYRVLTAQYGREPSAERLRTAPQPGSIESRLAALWQEFFASRDRYCDVLCLEDDVFALGADSLGALAMAERIEEVFGVRVPDDQMFQQTTIGAQAAMIRTAPRTGPAIARHRLVLRLLRPSGADETCHGTILGLPGIGGNAPYLGSVAANALHAFDIWAASVDLGGRSSLEDDAWLDCARLIAVPVQGGRMPPAKSHGRIFARRNSSAGWCTASWRRAANRAFQGSTLMAGCRTRICPAGAMSPRRCFPIRRLSRPLACCCCGGRRCRAWR